MRYFMIILNIPAVVILSFGLKWTPATLILALAITLVPDQLRLRERWSRCEEEAWSMIAYVEDYNKKPRAYPDDLSGHPFIYPALKSDFHYEKDTTLLYQVRYNIASEGTSHAYRPGRGWFFYPD